MTEATSCSGSLIFCAGQCRNSHGSGGGTIFDAEFAQDAFDVLVDRPVHALRITPIALSHMLLVGNGWQQFELHRESQRNSNCWIMSTVKLELKIKGQVIGSTVSA
ncbi:MAG: hypothetical protein WAN04_13785 [Candidatus Udaeobacter sp.]